MYKRRENYHWHRGSGVVNEEGILKYISNIPELEGINLTSLLKQKIKVPVTVINDANAAAIAEAKDRCRAQF